MPALTLSSSIVILILMKDNDINWEPTASTQSMQTMRNKPTAPASQDVSSRQGQSEVMDANMVIQVVETSNDGHKDCDATRDSDSDIPFIPHSELAWYLDWTTNLMMK